jgi:hypothetical protein
MILLESSLPASVCSTNRAGCNKDCKLVYGIERGLVAAAVAAAIIVCLCVEPVRLVVCLGG